MLCVRIFVCNHFQFLVFKETETCKFGYAYHSGKMVNDNAPAKTAAECLDQCNILPACEFWDFGNNYCRLRSNDGNGLEDAEMFTSGIKYCQLGRLMP